MFNCTVILTQVDDHYVIQSTNRIKKENSQARRAAEKSEVGDDESLIGPYAHVLLSYKRSIKGFLRVRIFSFRPHWLSF